MPYKDLSELINELSFDKRLATSESDRKLIKIKISHAIEQIHMTDTQLIIPWIDKILYEHRTQPEWSSAYQHWRKIRHVFYGSEQNESEISSNPKAVTLHKEVEEVAAAITNIDITSQNLDSVLLLACTILGLYQRFGQLDKGKIEHFGYNAWTLPLKKIANLKITRTIIERTGKNRQQNFNALYEAINHLVNKNPLLRSFIPEEIVTPINTLEEEPIQTLINADEKFNLEIAIQKSQDLEREIQHLHKKLLSNIKITSRFLQYFQTLSSEINKAITANNVIPYDDDLAKELELTDEEKKNWYNFTHSSKNNTYTVYNNIVNYIFLKKNVVNIMLPLVSKMHDKTEEISILNAIITRNKQKLSQLTHLKAEIDTKIQEAKHEKDEFKQQKSNKEMIENSQIETKQVQQNIVFAAMGKIECGRSEQNRIQTRAWWEPLLLDLAGASLGAFIGYAIGYMLGITLGIVLGGLPTLITVPFCAIIGSAIGGILGGYITDSCTTSDDNTQSPESSIDEDTSCKMPVSLSNSGIARKLLIRPETSSLPQTEKQHSKTMRSNLISATHKTPLEKKHLLSR